MYVTVSKEGEVGGEGWTIDSGPIKVSGSTVQIGEDWTIEIPPDSQFNLSVGKNNVDIIFKKDH